MALESKAELTQIISTVCDLLKREGNNLVADILENGHISSELAHYDNWDGGQYYYQIYVSIPVDKFSNVQNKAEDLENLIQEKIETVNKAVEDEHILKTLIIPQKTSSLNWDSVGDLTNKEKLTYDIEFLKNTMISVSTGGQWIQEINTQYQRVYRHVDKILKRLKLNNPNPYNDLWEWYGKWSSDLPKYYDRRKFISEMFSGLLKTIEESDDSEAYQINVDLEGWPRIERTIKEIKKRLSDAKTEEQYQSIGHLSREVIISLAQEVYDSEKYPTEDGKNPSETDARKMLETYFGVKLGGSSNESIRRFSKSTLTLANELTHKRTATKKDALLCSLATTTLINIVKTIEEI